MSPAERDEAEFELLHGRAVTGAYDAMLEELREQVWMIERAFDGCADVETKAVLLGCLTRARLTLIRAEACR